MFECSGLQEALIVLVVLSKSRCNDEVEKGVVEIARWLSVLCIVYRVASRLVYVQSIV